MCSFTILILSCDVLFGGSWRPLLSEWGKPPAPVWAWRARIIRPSDTAKIEQNAFLHTRVVVSPLGTWYSLVNFQQDSPRLSLYPLLICCTLTQPHKYPFCTSKFLLPQNPSKRDFLWLSDTVEKHLSLQPQHVRVGRFGGTYRYWSITDCPLVLQSLVPLYLSSFPLTTSFEIDTYFFPEFLRRFCLFFCHVSASSSFYEQASPLCFLTFTGHFLWALFTWFIHTRTFTSARLPLLVRLTFASCLSLLNCLR